VLATLNVVISQRTRRLLVICSGGNHRGTLTLLARLFGVWWICFNDMHLVLIWLSRDVTRYACASGFLELFNAIRALHMQLTAIGLSAGLPYFGDFFGDEINPFTEKPKNSAKKNERPSNCFFPSSGFFCLVSLFFQCPQK
jgi:hypothetical protein